MFDTGRSVDEIIESLNEDKIYGLEIHHVLLRKDGALLFPRLKEALLNNPSSHKLNILANYIRPAENRDNYETSGFDDDRFIEEIKDRHYPQIRILSKERIVAIYDRLLNILETEPEADYAPDIAFYMFDSFKNLDAIDAERKRRLKVLGTDLCLKYRHPDWGLVVFALLYDFGGGGIIKEKELIALLEEYLEIEGFTDSTSTVVTTLFKHYQNDRSDDTDNPIDYPVSCSPQAWAAGSLFQLLSACLNMQPDAVNKTLRIVEPALPEWLGKVILRNIRCGDAQVDLAFTSRGNLNTCEIDLFYGFSF